MSEEEDTVELHPDYVHLKAEHNRCDNCGKPLKLRDQLNFPDGFCETCYDEDDGSETCDRCGRTSEEAAIGTISMPRHDIDMDVCEVCMDA